mmetsp:Transcript_45209/g.120234  ORF Transcript_45209/g.120234 Transcript_45209/m.120234 type:complete len:108 (+) Transcript_45209:96-419(+)
MSDASADTSSSSGSRNFKAERRNNPKFYEARNVYVDDVDSKKQRRREKNRASAQQSRQRKKFHLETLEQQVDCLEEERKKLLERVQLLRADNESLRAALASLGAVPA